MRDLHGVGTITTALVLGEVGDVARFRDRNHFASYNGTAPCDRGSAGNPRPSVSPHGNRRLNHAIHVVAVTQVRNDTPVRALYARKISEGKTKKEALRVVKRRVSDAIYRQLVNDAAKTEAGPGGQTGTTLQSSVTGSTPTRWRAVTPSYGGCVIIDVALSEHLTAICGTASWRLHGDRCVRLAVGSRDAASLIPLRATSPNCSPECHEV